MLLLTEPILRIFHCDVKMVIANNNNADEDNRNMDNQNMFRNDNGNKIHVIPEEEEEDEFTPEELKKYECYKR